MKDLSETAQTAEIEASTAHAALRVSIEKDLDASTHLSHALANLAIQLPGAEVDQENTMAILHMIYTFLIGPKDKCAKSYKRLQTCQDITFYSMSASFPSYGNEGADLSVQYHAKYEKDMECGGRLRRKWPDVGGRHHLWGSTRL